MSSSITLVSRMNKCTSEEVKMHFSYAKRYDTSDNGDEDDSLYITVANIKSNKRNKERHSASQHMSGRVRTITQIQKEYYQEKRGKWVFASSQLISFTLGTNI